MRGLELLQDRVFEEAKPEERPYKLFDGGGLFLLVKPSGSKLWHYAYRHEGKERLMALGNFLDVNPKLARERHRAARRLLEDGTDPMEERKAKKVAVRFATEELFENVAREWFEQIWRVDKEPKYVDTVKRRLEDHILRKLGRRPISSITAVNVRDVVKAVKAPVVAGRVFQMIRSIFKYAITNQFAKSNPTDNMDVEQLAARPKVRHRARIDLKDLPQLLRVIEDHRGRPETRLAMQLMALTFLRASELTGGRWEEIDWEKRRWDVPAERMKMEDPHIVPLAPQTIELLKRLRNLTGTGPFMFPSDGNARKKETMSTDTILKALRSMGYESREMCQHGFRGLFSTWAHEAGYSHSDIELQLSHSPRDRVSAAYNFSTRLDARRELMEAWASHLEEAATGGKVVSIVVAS